MSGPAILDRAPIERRLITMRKAVGQLESLGGLQGDRLREDSTAGLVIERILVLLAGLAFAINRQVSEVVLDELPPSPEAAFGATGWVAAHVGS
jgi:hypothetical protein